MKKLLILLTAALLAATSCKGQLEFVYHADITGEADGNVLVTFPDGRFNLDGCANLAFTYANDTISVEQVICTPEQAVLQGNRKAEKVLKQATPFVDAFNVTSAGGNYDILIKGYVTERKTGITLKIDKRFTNR